MGDDGERFAMRDLRDTRAEERGRELAEWAGPGREKGGGTCEQHGAWAGMTGYL